MFYKLSELAKRWNKTEDEILHIAVTGQLVLSMCHFGVVVSFVITKSAKRIVTYPGENYCFSGLYGRIPIENIKSLLIYENDEERLSNYVLKLFMDDGRTAILYKGELLTRHKILASYNEVTRIEGMYPELLRGKQQKENQDSFPQNVEDEYIYTNKEIEAESGLSYNTFKKYAESAGIKIEKTEDSKPKSKIKKSDMKRVVNFRKNFSKNKK